MAAFGLLGGLLAWAFVESIVQLSKTDLERILEDVRQDLLSLEKGRITQTQAEEAFKDLEKKHADNSYMKVFHDRSLPRVEARKRVEEIAARDRPKQFVAHMIMLGLAGIVMATSLSVAEPIVTRNLHGSIVNGSIGALLGLIGGLLVSLFLNSLYQGLGGGQLSLDEKPNLATLIFARSVAWGVLGLFMSAAPGIVMRNWKKLVVGLAGGLIGGLLGGLLFDPIGMATESGLLSRLIGIMVIGVAAGVATGLIENAAKLGWLRVTAGLITGKQFILYRNPTYIGSSPQCEVYLFKDPQIHSRHAAVHVVPGGFDLEDQGLEHRHSGEWSPVSRVRLRAGDQIQIGSTCFTFQEKVRAGL